MGFDPESVEGRGLSRRLAVASARRHLAQQDFYVEVAEVTETMPQKDAADALFVAQSNVSRWASAGRERRAGFKAGSTCVSAYEVAQRYATGQLDWARTLELLATWPYEESVRDLGEWQFTQVSPEDSFAHTVGRALDDGLLRDEEYTQVLDRSGAS